MNTDIMLHVLLALSSILIVSIFGLTAYIVTLNREVKEQEKEIARLKTALKREKRKEPLYIIQDGKNPKFGGF